MTKILVAYTTNSGSTEEVAQEIAKGLEKSGAQAEVRRLEEVASLEDYQAVIVGAPMILGWHRAAQNFVKKHRAALASRPVAYFCTAMSLTQTGEERVQSVPVCIDPWLAKPAQKPGSLSFKERYALPSNYIAPMLKAAPEVKPVSIGLFGGKLELFRLNIFQMLFVMLVIRAQPGDLRNWSAIGQWAAEIGPALCRAG